MTTSRRTTVMMIAALSLVLIAGASCKSSGMAVTERGQLFKINIEHPTDLPESGEDNLDVLIANRGVNNIQNVLVEVQLPPQLVVLNQTNERGVEVSHAAGSNTWLFTLGNVQPAETSRIRFNVRTAFGTMRETESVKVTAWQKDLPGDRLVETAVIRLRP